MSLPSAVVISAFTLFTPSSDIAKQTPVSSLEVATRIEQRVEVNQMKEFTRTMNEQTYVERPEPSPTHPSPGGWGDDGYN
jgi:hypothetical protein